MHTFHCSLFLSLFLITIVGSLDCPAKVFMLQSQNFFWPAGPQELLDVTQQCSNPQEVMTSYV